MQRYALFTTALSLPHHYPRSGRPLRCSLWSVGHPPLSFTFVGHILGMKNLLLKISIIIIETCSWFGVPKMSAPYHMTASFISFEYETKLDAKINSLAHSLVSRQLP